MRFRVICLEEKVFKTNVLLLINNLLHNLIFLLTLYLIIELLIENSFGFEFSLVPFQ